MNLLQCVGGVVALVLTTVGLFWLWKLDLLGSGLYICIMGLISGPVLGFGLYIFHLRDRITALEKRGP